MAGTSTPTPPETTEKAKVLTREDVVTTLVQPLQAASVFLAAGPRIIDTAGPLRIPYAPTYTDKPMPMTGEGEKIPQIAANFDQMQMLPSTMRSFKAIDHWTNELARQSFVDIGSVLRARLVEKVAADVDAQLLGSSGDGITAPRGLGAYQGVTEVPVGGPLTIQSVLDGEGALLAANAPTDGLTLFVRVADYMRIRSTQDPTRGGYVVVPDVQNGGLVVPLLGARVVVTDRIAKGTAYLVHMPSIVVARDVNPAVTILTETFAEYDEVGIRVVTRLDAAPLQPKAVVRFTGIA